MVSRVLLPTPNRIIGQVETMTKEERQALREKHQPLNYGDGVPPQCLGCDDNCIEGDGIDWPCDVIKVLDAWEATL